MPSPFSIRAAYASLWTPRRRFAAVDGLRVLFFLWVMNHNGINGYSHASPAGASSRNAWQSPLRIPGKAFSDAGNLGVNGFFVLSGFLATPPLRRQYAAAKRAGAGGIIPPGLLRFYLRRWARLWPALAAMLALTAAWPGLRAACLAHGAEALLFADNYLLWLGQPS